MKDWQTLIGAVIIGAAIIGAALILSGAALTLSDAIRYCGEAINAGFTLVR